MEFECSKLWSSFIGNDYATADYQLSSAVSDGKDWNGLKKKNMAAFLQVLKRALKKNLPKLYGILPQLEVIPHRVLSFASAFCAWV